PVSGIARDPYRPEEGRLSRARAARLPRADRAREPQPLWTALPRPGAARAHRDAARALRSLGGAASAHLLVFAGDDAAARALSGQFLRPTYHVLLTAHPRPRHA